MPYHLPVNFRSLLKKGGRLQTVSLKESIREYIYLILQTQRGEWRYDADFQCLLWEKDFEQTDNLNLWLDEVKEHIKKTLYKWETRLKIQSIDIRKDELEERNRENKICKVRNRIKIRIRGMMIQSSESFDEEFLMFFGPITVI